MYPTNQPRSTNAMRASKSSWPYPPAQPTRFPRCNVINRPGKEREAARMHRKNHHAARLTCISTCVPSVHLPTSQGRRHPTLPQETQASSCERGCDKLSHTKRAVKLRPPARNVELYAGALASATVVDTFDNFPSQFPKG